MDYASVEPFGEYWADLRHGQQMHLLDKAHFKRDTPKEVSDFRNYTIIAKSEPLTDDEYYDKLDKEVFGI